MAVLKENNESLVDLLKLCPSLINEVEEYRMKKEKSIFLRKTPANMLKRALKLLPSNLTFKVYDAWRPSKIQEKYFRMFRTRFKKQFPLWDDSKLDLETAKYVHPFAGEYASGHLTGGAVDVYLAYRKNNRSMQLCSERFTYQENSKTSFNKLAPHILENRKLMFRVLSEVGFINYPMEYWHWSYGDIRWAESTGEKYALYGVVDRELG